MHRILPLIVTLVLCGCSKSSTQAAAPAASPAAAAQTVAKPEPPKPVPAQLPEVLARVNGEAITRAEFDRAVGALESRAGAPVPADQRDQVLQRFVRLDPSRTTPGSGLGLPLVNAIAKLHGARLELDDNRPGLVARFRFLPKEV